MTDIKRYISVFAVGLISVCAMAQNLDPTVEVSRAYEGKLMEINKPVREMTVPDSVSTFRLDFDYSVFDKPYKGAYEFNPYLMNMRPGTIEYDPRNFYLKVGAGYRLYPELDLVWSPAFEKGFGLDVYADHSSYVGDYRTIDLIGTPDKMSLKKVDDDRWKGYDLSSTAGATLKYDWQKGRMSLDLNYHGLHGKTAFRNRAYDSFNTTFFMASNKEAIKNFVYGVLVDYRFAEDKLKLALGDKYLSEHVAGFDVYLGPVFRHGHRVTFDVGGDMAVYGSSVKGGAGGFDFTPSYIFNKGRWNIDAGVRLDIFFTGNGEKALFAEDKQQYLYPDVKIGFTAIKDAMKIYAEVTGGTKLNTYASLLEDNHHLDLTYVHSGLSLFDANVERVRTSLGFRGRIASNFSYDLRGGYVNYANDMLSALNLSYAVPVSAVAYSSYQKAFVALDWRWVSESIKFDGAIEYAHTWDFKRGAWAFAPAMMTGDVAFEYNWKRRLFAGVDCEFSTARKMVEVPSSVYDEVVLPAYADLGVSVEYVMNKKLSFWLRGGNLCCMTIQRTPLYAEGGINFTAGICLNL